MNWKQRGLNSIIGAIEFSAGTTIRSFFRGEYLTDERSFQEIAIRLEKIHALSVSSHQLYYIYRSRIREKPRTVSEAMAVYHRIGLARETGKALT